MRRSIAGVVVALSLLSGASALAANERRHKPSEYQELSDEDRAAARERARNRVGTWREAEEEPEYKFPWMQIGFTVLTLGIAVPFAWAAYQRQAKEIREREAATGGPPPRKRSKAVEEVEE